MAKSNISRQKDIANSIRCMDRGKTVTLSLIFITGYRQLGLKAFKGVKRKELARLLGVSTSTLNVNEAFS
jgi:hypothetical protein